MLRPSFVRLAAALVLGFSIASSAHAQTTEVDLIIVYDSTAAEWVAARSGMTVFAQDAVDRMNQAFTNSDIDLQVNLVHVEAIPYDHSGDLQTDLNTISNVALIGGYIAELRNEHTADFIALFSDTGSAFGNTGFANIMGPAPDDGDTDFRPESAYSANSIRSVDISDVLAHEVGHNFGAHHSKNQDDSPGPNSALNEYSAGWYFTGNDDGVDYHTIMAYNNDGFGNTYDPTGIFSSPLLTYQGTTAGHAIDGDNARTLRETKDIAATYRDASLPPPVALAPTNRTDTSFTANWESVTSAVDYELLLILPGERLLSGRFGDVTSFDVDGIGLEPGETWYYRVIAIDEDGNQSGMSNPVFVGTTGGPGFNLDVITAGQGSGTVTSEPGSIDCGSTCSETFADGDTVTLSATPDIGSTFLGWTGPCSNESSTCEVPIVHDQTAIAWFQSEPVELTNGQTVTDLSGDTGSEIFFYIDTTPDAALTVTTTGGSGDADLYVRFGDVPTQEFYDCRPFVPGNEETCELENASAGRYYIMIRGFSAYSGLSLSTNYLGPPGKVTNLSTSSGAGSVTLSWDAPDEAGSDITDYIIQYSTDGGDTWTTFDDGESADTSATITGLTDGVRYWFRVIAVNAEGQGPEPDSDNIATATAGECTTCRSAFAGWRLAILAGIERPPAAITDLTVEAGSGRASLSWTAPDDGGSPITDYLIEYSTDDGDTWIVFDDGVSTDTMVAVTGLEEGNYLFRVVAINEEGAGEQLDTPVAAFVEACPDAVCGSQLRGWRLAIPDEDEDDNEP